MPPHHRERRRVFASMIAAMSLVVAVFVAPLVTGGLPTAAAAGTPDVQLTRTVATNSLYGVDIPVTLTAHQSSGADAYNLTFTDIIPPHTSFGSGALAPTQTIALPDGSTQLVWSNVADLLDNTSYALAYQLYYDPTFFDVPASIGGIAGAYVNTDARTVPKVSATGVVSSFTGSGTATGTTALAAFLVSKSEPSDEGELLRGVHDHITTYTITVTNNAIKTTSNLRVSDYLPAGLEFLGCTAGDTSAPGSEEYPGAGRIPTIAPVPNCNPTYNAETRTVDPDGTTGPITSGVYTEVDWTGLGALPANGVLTLSYAAAIPMHENVAAPGVSAVGNLDNNTGPMTTDEQALVNHVGVVGNYEAADQTVWAKTQVTAEDVLIHKTVDKATIKLGQTSTWSLDILSSEYAASTDDIAVTDTIPDGLDYTAGSAVPAMVGDPVGNANGTLTATWLVPGFTTVNAETTISYQTTTRATYRATNGDVSANDTWDNTVHLGATAHVITSTGATQAEAVIDDSDATQTAAGVALKKEVASPADLSGGCTNSLTWNDDTAGDFHPGDTVCYRLTVSYPDLIETLGTTMTDFLPAGMSFVSVSPTATNDVTGLTFSQPSAGVLRWTDNGSGVVGGSHFQVIVTTTITDPLAVVASDLTSNLFKLRYRSTNNTTFQLRDLADITWNQPAVAIAKKITSINAVAITPAAQANVQGGDVIGYTVTVTNTGKERADNVSVRDLLPDGWTCANVTDAGGGTCAAAAITWVIPSVAGATSAVPSIPGTASVSYSGTAPTGAAPGDAYINSVGVRQYTDATNTGGSFTYVPKSNIDPTLEPSANVPAASANASAEADIAVPTVVKALTTAVNEGGNNTATQATIGELATYTITTTIPQGTTMYASPTITDAIVAQLAIQGTPTFTINGGVAQDATVSGQNVTIPLSVSPATTYVNAPQSGDDVVVLTVKVQVRDVNGPVRGTGIANSAVIHWSNGSGTTRTASGTAPALQIVEPLISIVKTSNAGTQALPGQNFDYFLTVGNSGAANVSTGHDVTVTDVLPSEVVPLTTGDVDAADGATLPGGGVWSAAARTITFTSATLASLATLAPGASVAPTYRVRVIDPLVSDGTIHNTATATTTSLAGTVAGERTTASALGGVGSGYLASTSLDIKSPNMTLTKTATPSPRTIGQAITYTLTLGVPADTISYDATLIDKLPTGVRFDHLVSASCSMGGNACSPALTPTLIGTPTATDRTIGYFIGDMPTAASALRAITIQYVGIVVSPAKTGDVQTNTVRIYLNKTDKITGTPTMVPVTSGFDVAGATATAGVSIVEPKLTIDKRVAGQVADTDFRRAKPGDLLHYTVAVKNTGTSPAYDIIVNDTPDPRLLAYTGDALPAGVTAVDTDPSDGKLQWIVTSIAVGATVTIGYNVTVPSTLTAADEIVAGTEINNTASVASYHGVATVDQVSGVTYKTYTDVTPDTVNVELDLASLGDRVWFDVNGNGVQDPGEPGLPNVGITVLFAGADGVFGTADDETATTTTDSMGAWLVDHLPGGLYRVTVGAGIPSGMTPSYDLDNGTVAPNGVWQGTLAENGVKRDVDFGYAGTGSIGRLVWFDRNEDGVQNTGEPGLDGATVTVVWAGATGVPAATYTVVTNATGGYSVGRLPAGSYTVTVSGLPAGYTVVSDPQGPLDGVSVTSLTAGQNRTDQNFGYAGSSSLGDLVWLDRNGDGIHDTGEPGISGAQVTVVWYGPDGIQGTADDGTFTTTTAVDGSYRVGNLLSGTYRVTVVSGVANALNSHDPDGPVPGDSTALFDVPNNTDVTTADFGYHVSTVIGDTVWWDINGDGVQQTGEPGIPNVSVKATYLGADGVLGGGDDTVDTVKTDANGHWDVINLPNGAYIAQVTAGIATGFSPTYDSDGIATPNRSAFILTDSNLDQDFGYTGTGSIGDLVWLDQNSNGIHDAAEPGLGGVKVTLVWFGADGVPGGGDDLTLTTTTAADGTYRFGSLPGGNFSVTVDTTTLAAGSTATHDVDAGNDSTALVTLAAGQARTDVDFGYRGAAAIGDTVWDDRNANGTVDSDESGIAGVAITAYSEGPDGHPGTVDDVTITTVTNAAGYYQFSGLTAGAWTITVSTATLPAGVHYVSEEDGVLDGVDVVTLNTSTSHQTADFGVRGAGSIGDTVYDDVNGDGAQDAGEPGIPDQVVQVRWAGVDGALGNADDELWNVTTDAGGHWTVENLPAGNFRVTVVGGVVGQATNTGDPDGGGDSTSLLTLASGASNLAQDFGYHGDNQLGDTVWWDLDANGAQDATDPGLPDVTVTATWFGPDGVQGGSDDLTLTTVTDAAGHYGFAGLPNGTYLVTVGAGIPSGLSSSVDPDSGTPDGTSMVTLSGATINLDQDFGYVGGGKLGETVWLDRNGNGVIDRPSGSPSFEPGIPNVTVTLVWEGPVGTTGHGHTWTTTTDSTGAYLFEHLPAGNFHISLTNLPAGLTATADPDGGTPSEADVSLASQESNLDQNFGYLGGPSVGDTLYIDVNDNGIQDADEPGIGGVKITARQAGADGVLNTPDDVITIVRTDTDGKYVVGGLPVGVVNVSYDPTALPAGYFPGNNRDGTAAPSSTLTLGATDHILDVDFGVVGSASLSGIVYDDANGNGVRDPGETGLPGVTVNVVWAGPRGPVTVPVVADSTGAWSQTKLPAGSYTVTLDASTIPAGYRITTGSSQLLTLVIGGTAFIPIGLTSLPLPITGTPLFPGMVLGLLLLLLGAGIAVARRFGPMREPAPRGH